MNYRVRHPVVEAEQFCAVPGERMPDGVSQDGRRFFLATKRGRREVTDGAFIVKDGDDRFACPATLFRRLYEPAGDTAGAMREMER